MLRIAINRREVSGVRYQKEATGSLQPETCYLTAEAGFTLLELLITLAIIAVILALANSPDLEMSNAKTSFKNSSQTLQTALSNLRNQSLSLGTTTRMNISLTGGVYNITTYASTTPVTGCTSTGIWTQLSSSQVKLHSLYKITGTNAMANMCFYRDGTASGGTLTILPIAPGTTLKSAVINVTIATGYLDVTTGYIDAGGVLNADPQ
jgi:hypothetical protein